MGTGPGRREKISADGSRLGELGAGQANETAKRGDERTTGRPRTKLGWRGSGGDEDGIRSKRRK